MHEVLDHDHGHAPLLDAPERAEHLGDLLWVEAGEHLVGEEQQRLCGERARELEALLLRHVQLPGGELGLLREPERGEHLLGDRRRRAQRQVLAAEARADGDVREAAEVVERPHDLVCARDPAARDLERPQPGDVLALERDAPGPRPVDAVDRVEERRLARAVRADEPQDRALLDAEARAVDRDEPAEADGDAVDGEDRHWMYARSRGKRLRSDPTSPAVTKSTVTRSSRPASASWRFANVAFVMRNPRSHS